MAERIGFVGVGRMGANMARRLSECGYPVTALFDVNRAAARGQIPNYQPVNGPT
jgi:3-hydroxyisobutyrate dehydrogenase-like beta-hydroxyacid dehydrogenase